MIVLLLLHLVAGAVCIAAGDRWGRRAFLVAGAPVLVTLLWVLTQLSDVIDGDVVREARAWVPQLGLTLDLRLDAFAALMLLLVSGIGTTVFVYAGGYHADGGAGTGRSAGLLAVFAGAMTGLVLADDLLVLVTCWELTSITSYLLIGNKHTQAKARAAALHALVITGAGGMCLLAGAILLGQSAGTYSLTEILADPPGEAAVGAALALVLLGVVTKSAQYPFHGWLPGAMVAPTPISAYLHSATMVKAGIYLLARLAPVFATYGAWRPVVIGIGCLTMVAGGLRALRQHDLKLLLAFGTVSQLGFLVVLAGAGVPEATTAACVLLLAHGAFKAALFFVVGTLDRAAGTRDRRALPPLGAGWGPVVAVAVVSAASMAGVPLALGFIAKEAAYAALADGAFSGSAFVLAVVVAGSALTAAYSWRFAEPILRAARAGREAAAGGEAAGRPGSSLVVPGLVLGWITLGFGLLPGVLDDLVGSAAASLDARTHAPHLALYHGLELPLLLSALTFALAAGVVGVAARAEARWPDASKVPTSADVYRLLLRGLNRGADRVTGVVQSGSLPIYAGTILVTAAVLPTAALLLRGDPLDWPEVSGPPAHLALSVLLVGAALAAATIRRRLSAVLFLGVVGYAMAGLFVVQGAPDLALTQVTVETLSTVLFVLVLRRLPVNFERKSHKGARNLRIAVAAAVGVGVFVFAVHVGTLRTETPVADEMVEQALPEGNGRNVVNVILVDIRGFDTMGEITVLATASIGMVALARAGRRPRRAAADVPAPSAPAEGPR